MRLWLALLIRSLSDRSCFSVTHCSSEMYSKLVLSISKSIQFDTNFSSSFHFPLVILLHAGPYPEFFLEAPVFEIVIRFFPCCHQVWVRGRKFRVFEASDPLKANC